MALDFPSSPLTTDIHNAANGLQYVFDGVKWVSQGRYDTGTINAEKLDSIASSFNGVLTTFNLKVNNVIVKPASAEALHIVLAGHLQEPATAYTINSGNGTITFASAPSNGTAFFGVILSRLPIVDFGDGTVTNAKVAANAAIDGTKINPNFGSQTITGVTTTQGSTDNTTKLASTAFVQTAVSNLVDSSPDTLNTLNELAAALGDDAAFSTTVTNALATKAPLASPTFTGTVSGIDYDDLDNKPTIPSQLTTENVQDIVGAMVTGNTETGISVTYNDAGDGTGKLNFATTGSVSSSQTFDDNVKAIFGTSNDGLEIYHDGNNSVIDDTGTGDLLLFGTSIKLQRTNSTPESLMIEAFGGNAVKLYYDGALKFETDTSGAKWSGDLFADAFTNSGGGKIKMGPSGALQIYHDNTNSIIDDSGTGSLLVYGSNVIIQESGTTNVMADFHPNTVKLYKSNKEKLVTTDNGIEIKGDSSNSTDGSIQLNCSANSHGVKIKSPNHSAGQSYTIILPDNQIAVNKILKVKSISGSGSTAIGQLEFADDTDTALPTASSSTLGGIKVGTNLSIDGNGVLSASQLSLTSSNINAAFGDTTQLILGAADGDGDDALKLYYGTGSGTNYGVITADNGVHIQFDGANRLETHASGTKWIGDLNCDDNQTLKLGSSADLKIYHDSSNNFLQGANSKNLYIAHANVAIFNEAQNSTTLWSNGSTIELYAGNSKKFETTSGGIDVTGNITVTGTVDGVDIAALNTTVSGIASPTATTINALYPDNGNLILGTGTGDDTLKLYYDGTNGKITSDNAIHLQQDGANKLEISSSGTKWIGDLFCDDSQILKLGSSADLQIFHNGSNSYIDNSTGLLYLRGADNYITNANGTKTIARFASNALHLYYDNVKRFETGPGYNLSTGDISPSATETYNLGGTSAKWNNAFFGQNVYLYGASNSNSAFTSDVFGKIIFDNGYSTTANGPNKIIIQNDTSGGGWYAGIGISSNEVGYYSGGNHVFYTDKTNTNQETGLKIIENGAVELYHDNSKKFETNSTGIHIFGNTGHADGAADLYGASNDLSIFHDGTHSRIVNTTNYLTIKSDQLALTNGAGDHDYISVPTANQGVRLHYDNDVKAFTYADGLHIDTGILRGDDNAKIVLGASSDLQIYHDGSHSYIKNATNDLRILANEVIFNSLDNSENKCKFINNGAVELYYNNEKVFYTEGDGAVVQNADGAAIFKVVGYENTRAEIQLWADDGDDPSDKWHLRADQLDYFQIAGLGSDGAWNAAFYAIPNGRSELLYDGVKKLETGTTYVRVTGDLSFNDGYKVLLGNSNDLQIYHDGSHSYIANSTGNLYVNAPNFFHLGVSNGGEKYITALENGAVELYYDNSKKFETENLGVKVYGHIFADDNNELRLGNSGDLQIFHDGTSSRIHNATGNLTIKSDSTLGLYSYTGTEAMGKFIANGAVELYYDNSKKFETTSSGVKWTGDLFCDDNQAIKLGNSADLRLYHDGAHSYINDAGTGSLIMLSSRYEFKNTGNDAHAFYADPENNTYLYYNGSYKLVTESIGVSINGVLRPAATNSHDLGASDRRWATIYAVNALNTSDENEKKDINNCDLGLDFVNKINPVSYKWKDSQLGSKTHYGLLAQNIEDAVKSVGKTLNDFGAIHKPEQDAMALNYNQLIAPLVKAIQELSDKVAALEAA